MNSVHQVDIKPSAREKMLSFSQGLKRRQSKNQNKVTRDTNNEMKSTSDCVEDAKENRTNEGIEKELSREDSEEKSVSEDAETLCTNQEEDPADEKSNSCSESRLVVSEVTQTWHGNEWNLWKTVTNIQPQHNTQVPVATIDEECGNNGQNTKVQQRLPLLSNNSLLDTIQQKLALKKIKLPPLCPCGHDTSVFDLGYSDKCCVNCEIYKDKKQHERLLRTMLKSFKLL